MANSKRGTKIASRLLVYLLRTLIALGIVALLATYAFYLAMNASNLYILASDGMNERTKAILMDESSAELEEYFIKEFIEKDSQRMRLNQEYSDYVIRNFEYSLQIESINVTPWGSSASMTATDNMLFIDGELPSDKLPEGTEAGTKIFAPQWVGARYKIEFRKTQEGRWFITDVQLVELAPSLEPKNTPMPLPSASVAPAASPTPAASQEPSEPTPTPGQGD